MACVICGTDDNTVQKRRTNNYICLNCHNDITREWKGMKNNE